MQKMRTLDEVTEAYFRAHPEEIDDYLTEIFQDFAEDNDTGVLLASLRVIARVRGVSDMAAQIGMSRQGIQKALSDGPVMSTRLKFLAFTHVSSYSILRAVKEVL